MSKKSRHEKFLKKLIERDLKKGKSLDPSLVDLYNLEVKDRNKK